LHLHTLGFQRLLALVAMGVSQLASVVVALEVVGEGDARLADRGELGAALGDDLVFVEGGGVVSVVMSNDSIKSDHVEAERAGGVGLRFVGAGEALCAEVAGIGEVQRIKCAQRDFGQQIDQVPRFVEKPGRFRIDTPHSAEHVAVEFCECAAFQHGFDLRRAAAAREQAAKL
jgi:hypothetical protein